MDRTRGQSTRWHSETRSPLPATGAISALITKATCKESYIAGKPNPRIFRSALNRISAHSHNTAMIGEHMDTDIIARMEAGLHAV